MTNHTARGIFYLCLGILVFSLQDAIIKQVSGAYALTEVLAFRSLVGVPVLLVLVQREVGWRALLSPRWGLLALRSVVVFVSYMAYYMAFPALPLADAVALYFTVPLFVTALAGPVLGEKLGWKVGWAVLLGFVGVVVMLQPGSGLFEPAALLSLLSAALYGGGMMMARRLGTTQVASVMSFHQNAFFLLAAVATAVGLHQLGIVRAEHPSLSFLVRPWVLPTLLDGTLMAVCGVVAAVGTLLLTSAYRIARASAVTPFEYTGILWGPTWGYLFFNEVPRATTVLGGAIVVVAGLVALRAAKHP
jgi:drug/metabolite transporter (DMT)-like permease